MKSLQTTDDGRQVMAIVHLDLWSRLTKNEHSKLHNPFPFIFHYTFNKENKANYETSLKKKQNHEPTSECELTNLPAINLISNLSKKKTEH